MFELPFLEENSSDPLKSSFEGVDDYMSTVDISKTSDRSIHQTGKIFLSVKGTPIAQVHSGVEVERYINAVKGMKTLGEEGLLGHRGHFIQTNSKADLFCLKKRANCNMFPNELIGKLGQTSGIDLLKKNKEMFSEYLPEDIMDFLYERSDYKDEASYFDDFTSVIDEYLYVAKGKSVGEISEYLLELTENNYFRTELYKNKIRPYLENKFWRNFYNRIEKWNYQLAHRYRKNIRKRLKKLDSQESEKIQSYLKFGIWTRESFDQYLDFLMDYFG